MPATTDRSLSEEGGRAAVRQHRRVQRRRADCALAGSCGRISPSELRRRSFDTVTHLSSSTYLAVHLAPGGVWLRGRFASLYRHLREVACEGVLHGRELILRVQWYLFELFRTGRRQRATVSAPD